MEQPVDFEKITQQMNLGLNGKELALVMAALFEMPARMSYELLKRCEALARAANAEDTKPSGPEPVQLRPVSQAFPPAPGKIEGYSG